MSLWLEPNSSKQSKLTKELALLDKLQRTKGQLIRIYL